MRREWIEILRIPVVTTLSRRLPPCGGSGLKLFRRPELLKLKIVSLHAEGVD